jgi:hypothetical protein
MNGTSLWEIEFSPGNDNSTPIPISQYPRRREVEP